MNMVVDAPIASPNLECSNPDEEKARQDFFKENLFGLNFNRYSEVLPKVVKAISMVDFGHKHDRLPIEVVQDRYLAAIYGVLDTYAPAGKEGVNTNAWAREYFNNMAFQLATFARMNWYGMLSCRTNLMVANGLAMRPLQYASSLDVEDFHNYLLRSLKVTDANLGHAVQIDRQIRKIFLDISSKTKAFSLSEVVLQIAALDGISGHRKVLMDLKQDAAVASTLNLFYCSARYPMLQFWVEKALESYHTEHHLAIYKAAEFVHEGAFFLARRSLQTVPGVELTRFTRIVNR